VLYLVRLISLAENVETRAIFSHKFVITRFLAWPKSSRKSC